MKKSEPKQYLKFVVEPLKTCSLFSKRKENAGETAFEWARRRFMNAVTEDIRLNGVREEDAGCLDGGWVITPKERKFAVLTVGHKHGQHPEAFASIPAVAPLSGSFSPSFHKTFTKGNNRGNRRALLFPRGNSFCHFQRPPFFRYCPRSGSGVTSIINVCPRVAIVWQDTTKMMHALLLLRIEINVLVAVITLRWNVTTASA